MSRERPQRGFAAILAIALLVVLGSLGAAMALLSFGQQTGSASDVLGTRAYFAARAGLEWGMHHVLRPGGLDCAAVDSPVNNTFTFAGPGLAGFRVTIRCTESSHEEGGSVVTMFSLTSTACNDPSVTSCVGSGTPGSLNAVERQVRVVVGLN